MKLLEQKVIILDHFSFYCLPLEEEIQTGEYFEPVLHRSGTVRQFGQHPWDHHVHLTCPRAREWSGVAVLSSVFQEAQTGPRTCRILVLYSVVLAKAFCNSPPPRPVKNSCCKAVYRWIYQSLVVLVVKGCETRRKFSQSKLVYSL